MIGDGKTVTLVEISETSRYKNTMFLYCAFRDRIVNKNYYRLQTKFAKVMFLQVSVCPQGVGACMAGGRAWLRGVCMVAGGCAWDTTRYGQ